MRLALLAALALATLSACDTSEDEIALPSPTGPSISTSYFPLLPVDFERSGSVETATYPMPAITREVVTSGLVIAQLDLVGGEDGYFGMPVVVNIDGDLVSVGYAYAEGEVSATITGPDEVDRASALSGSTMKVVAVEPSAAGFASARAAVEAGEPAAALAALGVR